MCDRCNSPLPRRPFHANDWDGLEYCSADCANQVAQDEAEEEWAYQMEEAGFGPHEPYQICWHEVQG